MSGRDDMVLRPTIRETYGTDAVARSRADRRIDEQGERRGLFARLARRRAAQRLARHQSSGAAARRIALRKSGGRLVGSIAMRSLGAAGQVGRFMLNPTTAAGMLGAFAAVYATHKITGKPLSNVMQLINNYVLGSVDDEARARVAMGQRMASDDNLAAFIGRQGKINDEIRQAAELMFRSDRVPVVGASVIGTEFPALDNFDLILRLFEQEFIAGFESNRGKQHLATMVLAHSVIKNKGLALAGG
jgi:hypothetical protein